MLPQPLSTIENIRAFFSAPLHMGHDHVKLNICSQWSGSVPSMITSPDSKQSWTKSIIPTIISNQLRISSSLAKACVRSAHSKLPYAFTIIFNIKSLKIKIIKMAETF